jgi:hypothetical protein
MKWEEMTRAGSNQAAEADAMQFCEVRCNTIVIRSPKMLKEHSVNGYQPTYAWTTNSWKSYESHLFAGDD